MVALCVVELQCTGYSFENRGGDALAMSALEADVIVDTDSS
jgi:hypothetical protein